MLAFTLATTALVAFTSARSTAPHARLIRQRRGQGYGLTQDLTGQALLDFFRFEERVDASARYVGQDEGKQLGLVRINGDNSVTLSVSTAANASPRESVRISTNSAFNSGLFILDATHVPVGCGIWGAMWSVGHNECTWPACGELDVFETVNEHVMNTYSCHTAEGARMQDASGSLFSAKFMLDNDLKTNCAVVATDNQGCGLRDSDRATAGKPLNEAHGGVWALQYDAGAIAMHFFPRSAIPADISSGNPVPSGWGTPKALFNGFDIMQFVNNQILVINTALCGKWPSETWTQAADYAGQPESCAQLTGVATCEDYIANHGGALGEAYWQISSLKIYQQT